MTTCADYDGTRHVISDYGLEIYLVSGSIHRDDGPALISICGILRWYQNGVQYTPKCVKL